MSPVRARNRTADELYCAALHPGLNTFINRKATLTATAFQDMSAPQKQKLWTEIEDKLDALVDSEVFRAMQSDVRHSGSEAFRVTESPNKPEVDAPTANPADRADGKRRLRD
jgi:hypothetical protein